MINEFTEILENLRFKMATIAGKKDIYTDDLSSKAHKQNHDTILFSRSERTNALTHNS